MTGQTYLDKKAAELGLNVPSEKLREYEDYCPDVANIQSLDKYRDETISYLKQDFGEHGAKMPWTKVHPYFNFRPGELTIWTGKRGSGKSAMLSMITLALAMQREYSCICSFEMKPVETLIRMTAQYHGIEKEQLTPLAVEEFFTGLVGKLYLYRQVGSVTTKRMLAIARYCAIELGLKHVIVDSLMKCGITSEDVRKGEQFVNELQNVAKDHGIHIHLVAHQTKNTELGPEDAIRGSGMFADIADNIFQLAVDRVKAEKATAGKLDPEEDKAKPDYWLKLSKQRHSTVMVPRNFGFWGDKSMQFKPYRNCPRHKPDAWHSRRWLGD